MRSTRAHLLPPLLRLHLLELVVVPLVLVDPLVVQVKDLLADAIQEVLVVRYLKQRVKSNRSSTSWISTMNSLLIHPGLLCVQEVKLLCFCKKHALQEVLVARHLKTKELTSKYQTIRHELKSKYQTIRHEKTLFNKSWS